WRAADKGGVVCARGENHAGDRARKILLHVRDAGKRAPARTRRAGGASWWRNRVGTWKGVGAETGEGESADTGGRGSGCGSSVQHATGGGAVCTGRSGGRAARGGGGGGGAGAGNELGGG